MYNTDYLRQHSNLPGPRGNLELMYDFAKTANAEMVAECLGYINADTSNSPAEFLGMCGIVGFVQVNHGDSHKVIEFLHGYASHASWRIREAVAMGIQELAVGRLKEILDLITPWVKGSYLEQRAVVAGLSEPKLLKNPHDNEQVLSILWHISKGLDHDRKLTDPEISLRKALGYGWSVVIAYTPATGKAYFEQLFSLPGKHVKWIIKENLGKNRLLKMDAPWVESCQRRLK